MSGTKKPQSVESETTAVSEEASERGTPPGQLPGAAESLPEEVRGLVAVPEADSSSESQPEPSAEELAAALRREVEQLREEILRRRAEFENFRKRAERERAQASDNGAGAVVSELLPTLDNLERALTADEGEGLREGIDLILRNLAGALTGRGLTAEDPKGHAFDPERHEAVAHEATPGVEPGTIVEVLQKGYLFKNRLLRPALVLVAKDADASEIDQAVH